MINTDESDKLVSQHIANGDTEAAVKLLFKVIVKCAREKNFKKAEQLRERMLEVDPMALDEIISSAEIIEEEKSQALDPIHMQIWSRLYDMLDTEEKNELYFAMQDAVLKINQPVFLQGKLDTNLYFINHGQLKMIYQDKAGDVLLYTLGPGQLAGQENFFSNTVCTTSLVTLSNVNLKYLEKRFLLKLKNELPTLEQKLIDFCAGFPNATTLLQSKKEDTARLLLGRRISVTFNYSKSAPNISVDQRGTIVGIHPYPFEDYSIHVKFDKMLDRSVIDAIQRT